MAGKDFRVNVDNLRDALRDVRNLADIVNATDYQSGSIKELAKADKSKVVEALGDLAGDGDGTDLFSGSYGYEHDALTKTYGNLSKQLAFLEESIKNTIRSHENAEHNAHGNVNNAGGGMPSGGEV